MSEKLVSVVAALVLVVAVQGCRNHTGDDDRAAQSPGNDIAREERIVVHEGFNRDVVPNYTIHEIDPQHMVELRRTCSTLDSPSVVLRQVDSSFTFTAAAPNTEPSYFHLTDQLELVQDSQLAVPSDVASGLTAWNDDDPTRTFGNLPGLFPISAAVRSRDKRFVYYSADSPDMPIYFRRIVRFDTRSRKITGELVLNSIGCEEADRDFHGRVHFLFINDQGRLIALAGSDVHFMDHEHVRE